MSKENVEKDIYTIRKTLKDTFIPVFVRDETRKIYNEICIRKYEILFTADEIADLLQAIYVEKVLE